MIKTIFIGNFFTINYITAYDMSKDLFADIEFCICVKAEPFVTRIVRRLELQSYLSKTSNLVVTSIRKGRVWKIAW